MLDCEVRSLNKNGVLLAFFSSVPVLAVLVFATGFYYLPPGDPQPGHMLLLVVAIPWLLSIRSFPLDLPEKLLIAFVVYSVGLTGFTTSWKGSQGFLRQAFFGFTTY